MGFIKWKYKKVKYIIMKLKELKFEIKYSNNEKTLQKALFFSQYSVQFLRVVVDFMQLKLDLNY